MDYGKNDLKCVCGAIGVNLRNAYFTNIFSHAVCIPIFVVQLICKLYRMTYENERGGLATPLTFFHIVIAPVHTCTIPNNGVQ